MLGSAADLSERLALRIWTLSSSTYEDSSSVRYDGKEYVESLFKVRREKSATGAVQIGESVTVKTKSRV